MPELPEVEIVRQSLNKKILEKRVKKVSVEDVLDTEEKIKIRNN